MKKTSSSSIRSSVLSIVADLRDEENARLKTSSSSSSLSLTKNGKLSSSSSSSSSSSYINELVQVEEENRRDMSYKRNSSSGGGINSSRNNSDNTNEISKSSLMKSIPLSSSIPKPAQPKLVPYAPLPISSSTSSSSLSSADPHSTPARRRRIIADISKFLLKQYCMKACEHVHRFRIETANAIIIQCNYRKFKSYKLLLLLKYMRRYNAALCVQMLWRRYIARKCLLKLKLLYRMKLGGIVALICQRYCRGIMARKRVSRLRLLEQQRMSKMRDRSAKTLQRYSRGMLGRRLASKKRLARDMLDIKRWQACILIQSIARKRRGRNKYNRLKCNRSLLMRKLIQWRHWRIRRITYVIAIQKHWRRAIAQRKTHILRLKRNYSIVLMNNIINDAIVEIGIESLDDMQPISEVPIVPIMEIIVKLGIQLLEEMSYMGPSSVVDWCLEQYILNYKHHHGYSFGTVLLQVISAVENVMPEINTDALKQQNYMATDTMPPRSPSSDEQKRIEVDKWNKGEEYDKPYLECYPIKWNERVVLLEGVSISIEKCDTSIKIVVISSNFSSPVESLATSGPISVVIVLEAEDANGNKATIGSYDTLMHSDQKQSRARDSKSESKSDNRSRPPRASNEDRSDVKFCFKNATVLLALKTPTPIPTRPSSPVHTNELPMVEEIEDEPIQLVSQSRPMTAKILVTVAEEPLVDYDSMASKIQMAAHTWYNNRHYAAFKIQKFWKAIVIRRKWRSFVHDVMNHATKHIIIIQCIVRKFICKMSLNKMRKFHYRKLLQKNYMDLKKKLDNLDDSDLIESKDDNHAVSAVSYILRSRDYNNSNSITTGCIWGSEILEVLELPDPPPGCVLSSDQLIYLEQVNNLEEENRKHRNLGKVIDINEFTFEALSKKVANSLITEQTKLNKKVPTLYNTIAKFL